jgi:hypothetical protein
MAREHDAGQFEWVNAWAEIKAAEPVATAVTPAELPKSAELSKASEVSTTAQVAKVQAVPQPVMAPVAPKMPDDQLMRDIAEIERARDTIEAMPLPGSIATRRTQAFTLVPSRTTDPVPVVIGGVLALVMLTVFGAAAAMSKFAR